MNKIFAKEPNFNYPFNPSLDSKIGSLKELKPYIGKVVKFTSDWGKTWQYFLVDQFVFSETTQEITGIKCHSEKRLWNDRWVGACALFTKDSFVKGPYSEQQSYFQTASYDEFSDLSFEGLTGSGQLPKEAASKPCFHIFDPDYPIMKAPLTVVRSEKPTELAISVLFNPNQFDPRNPIVPSPTEIEPKSRTYTWNVRTQQDGSLSVPQADGSQEKVKMIWWEAIRKKNLNTTIDQNQATYANPTSLESLLTSILEKKGVQASEAKAFAQYWKAVFEQDYEGASLISVQLVEDADLEKFLPPMKVDSKETAFELKRFYFLFKPIEPQKEKIRMVNPKAYIESLKPVQIGPNAVIDLGGEVVSSKHPRTGKSDSQEFIDTFIKKHIVA